MKKSLLILASAGVAALTAQSAMADTYTFGAQYFEHDFSGDFQNEAMWGTFTDLVTNSLGPDGLPVFNTGHVGAPLTELNGSNEILWWTPGAHVTTDGSGTITSPFHDTTFYPPAGNGGGDGDGFETAIFSGTIIISDPSTVTFTFGGDDDVFLYVDGQNVGQLGGVHGMTYATPTTGTLSAGPHTFDLFFADRHTTGSEVYFSIDTEGLVVTGGVPEPATWGMMLAGFGILGLAMRRRKTTVSFA